jgi:hypothetical protein
MNPEEKPPSCKIEYGAWGNSALCNNQKNNLGRIMPAGAIARILALRRQNKYIFPGIESDEGVSSNYFGMITLSPFISDDIKYRVVD